MKALTISQPYATLIANGEKFVENRRWQTSHRGPLVIHAGKGSQYLGSADLAKYPTGCIVAVAELVACKTLHRIKRIAQDDQKRGPYSSIGPYSAQQVASHKHSEGPYCWVLCNVQKLDEPIPCSGRQSLWTPSDGIIERLKAIDGIVEMIDAYSLAT